MPTIQGRSMSFYSLSARDIDGKDVSLAIYDGRVALVVNVASECGFTPQYSGLQQLFTEYRDRGLVVLGFPSNEFGGQEPGSEAEIKAFCATKFHVTFPMFAKVSVKKGEGQSPVYRFLTSSEPAPRWNFTKYLVGKHGQVLNVFSPQVTPDSAELKRAIDAALADS
jgi:glutathione peroxidase